MADKDAAVVIEIKNGDIVCSGRVLYIKEKNGKLSYYLPGFDMYFSSDNHVEGMKVAKAMVKSFFIYWVEKENNFNNLILEITKLGFKALDHRNTVNKLLRGKTTKASFQAKAPRNEEFADAEESALELELA